MKNKKLEKERYLLLKAQESKEGYAELYTYFLNDVYRFSYSIVNDQNDAEDITSRVFVKLYEKIGDFEWRGISMKY